MAKRKSEGAKPGTIRAECAYLKRMLRLACAEKALRSMPVFPALPTSPARQGVLTEDEVLRVIEHLEPPVNDLVLALWVTGWRDRECRLLRWSDVNMAAGTITLAGARSKTDEARVLEFTASPTLALVIKARFLARGAGSVYVFERSPGQPVKDFRGAWDKAFAAAGLERRLVHDLRRSRATHLSRRGVPEHVIMELQGWKTRAMLDRYRISTRQQVSEALERADKPRSGTIPSQNPKTTTDGSDEQSA
jgi:integrase